MVKIKKNLFLIITAIVFIITVFFVGKAKISNEELYIFGYQPHIITSGSMEPELLINAFVLTRQVDYHDIVVGDIISFDSKEFDVSIVHQVVDITDKGFVTKGINNQLNDLEIVDSKHLTGKVVFKSNFFAYIINYIIRKGVIIGLLVPISLITLFIISIKITFNNFKSKETEYE